MPCTVSHNDSSMFKTLLLAVLCASGSAFAQADYATATLQGTVNDPEEKAIMGAKVTAINQATGAVKSTVSTEQGYRIPALMPGTYRLEVEASGFAKSVAGGVALTVGQVAIYNVSLVIGSASNTVEVTSQVALIQPEQTQQAN